MFLNSAELPRAALDYPLAFVREDSAPKNGGANEARNDGERVPVAILGLRGGENLFVDAQGRWQPAAYVPAYVRRYPFCVAQLPPAPGAEPGVLVCVDESQLVPSTTPLFDAHGEPTAAWKPVGELIDAAEAARRQTQSFIQQLEALELFLPFDALALPRGGAPLRLRGLYRVDESRLDALSAEQLAPLRASGALRAIYAHLLSLEQFARLMDLSAGSAGAAPAK